MSEKFQEKVKRRGAFLVLFLLSANLLFISGVNFVSQALEDPPSDLISIERPSGFGGGKFAAYSGDFMSTYGEPFGWLPSKDNPSFQVIFPVCDAEKFGNCIESLWVREIGVKRWIKGSVVLKTMDYLEGGEVAVDNGFGKEPNLRGLTIEDVAKGVPAGGTPSVWELPSAPHRGGDKYLVSVSFSSSLSQDGNTVAASQYRDFRVNLRPFSASKTSSVFSLLGSRGFNSAGYQFPQGFEYKLKLRLGIVKNQLGRFFFGRLDSPSIEFEGSNLTIAGTPVISPIARSEWVELMDVPEPIRPRIMESRRAQFESQGYWGALAGTSTGGPDELKFSRFELWEPYLRQVGQNSAWTLNSETYDTYKCKVDGVGGLVSSNAMIYSTSVPVWNPKASTVSYQMASLHLNEVGQQNRGNFNLVMSAQLLKCLSGITPSRESVVEVRLLYRDGTSEVTTSQIKVTKDWLSLRVNGYTFSAPKVQIQLRQGKSITCVKGKSSKKVTGENPKCPKGFKKK